MKTRNGSRRYGRRHGEDGAAAVEFALILIPFLVLTFGLIQYGLYFWAAQSGAHTANVAVRQLSVGNCQAAGALQTFVDDELGSAAAGTVSVATTYTNPDGSTTTPDGSALTFADVLVGGTVELNIEFPSVDMNFPLLPFMSEPIIRRTVDARVEDKDDEGCGT